MYKKIVLSMALLLSFSVGRAMAQTAQDVQIIEDDDMWIKVQPTNDGNTLVVTCPKDQCETADQAQSGVVYGVGAVYDNQGKLTRIIRSTNIYSVAIDDQNRVTICNLGHSED